MEDRSDKRIDVAAAISTAGQSVPENTSEGALWRDYLTSVLSIPIIRQEIDHEIQTTA